MSELFKGVVLEGVKSADSNASTTNEAEIKVVRDFKQRAICSAVFPQTSLTHCPTLLTCVLRFTEAQTSLRSN